MNVKRFISIIIVIVLSANCSLFSNAIESVPLGSVEMVKAVSDNHIPQQSADYISSNPNTSAIYSYSDNKIKQIASDTVKYNFNYNEVGNMTSSFIGEKLYAKYNYTSNSLVSLLLFGNNQTINKNYDENGRTTTVSYDNKSAFEYDYKNHGELGFEKDLLSSRITITDDIFEIISMDSHKQLFHIEETSNDSHLFSIFETDDIIRRVTDYQNQTQLEFYLEDGTKCIILCRYDDYDRLIEAEIYNDEFSIQENYTYINNDSDYVQTYTTLVTNELGKSECSWLYDYDEYGNVTSKSYSKNGSDYKLVNSYLYDKYGQLTTIFDESNEPILLEYDNSGNILKKEIVDEESKNDSIYSYSDSNWGDKLTAYNNNQIVYDEIGNPLLYNEKQYTWSAGRQLATYQNSSNNLSVNYTYDEIGHRTTKTIEENGSKIDYEYFWLGDTLIAMTVSGIANESVDTVYFLYDMNQNLYGFIRNGTDIYFYEKSETGDIIAIYNETGIVANYAYDTYGNIISICEEDENLRFLNPFYYRSYMFDRETEMFYLLSRYYIPEWGRFLNADAYFSTNVGTHSINMFAYCDNNPVNMSDPYGYWKKDDHMEWTENLADEAGMSSTLADKVGSGSYSVDIDMSTNPLRAPTKWKYNQRFHFDRRNYCDNISGGEDTRIYYANLYVSDAITKRDQGKTSEAADLLGKALHFLQDYSSHGNVGLTSSTASHGFGFDEINYDWVNDTTRVSVYQISSDTGDRYEETITITALELILYNL